VHSRLSLQQVARRDARDGRGVPESARLRASRMRLCSARRSSSYAPCYRGLPPGVVTIYNGADDLLRPPGPPGTDARTGMTGSLS
jgi:hypothetical protein